MRMLEAAPSCGIKEAEIARQILLDEITKPNRVVVVIRGNSPEIATFADRVDRVIGSSPWRQAIWVRDSRIMKKKDEDRWFGNAENACAVVLNFQDEPTGTLHADSSIYDIELSLIEAMRVRRQGCQH